MTTPSVRGAAGQLRPAASGRGRGWQELRKPANPAPGGGFTFANDGTYWRRLISLAATIATSATAGTRTLGIAYQDGDGFTYNFVPLSNEIGPSQTLTAYGDLATVTPVQVPESHQGEGSVTSPGAAATITSFSLPAGGWTLNWTIELAGTPAAGDANNFQLTLGAVQELVSINPGAVAGPLQQNGVQVQVPAGGATVAVKSIAAGTAGAIYTAQLVALPANLIQLQVTLPDFIVKSGWQIVLQLGSPQAGDQISGLGLLFENYPSSDYDALEGDPADRLAELIVAIAAGG